MFKNVSHSFRRGKKTFSQFSKRTLIPTSRTSEFRGKKKKMIEGLAYSRIIRRNYRRHHDYNLLVLSVEFKTINLLSLLIRFTILGLEPCRARESNFSGHVCIGINGNEIADHLYLSPREK